MQECATMAATGIFLDPVPRMKHQQNTIREVSNFDTTVLGPTSYEGGHSYCKGMQMSLNSLFVKKNLEVTVQLVTEKKK